MRSDSVIEDFTTAAAEMPPFSKIKAAETLLKMQRVTEALPLFNQAELEGAGADRCAAGRWTCWMLMGRWQLAWEESDRIRARGLPDPHRFWNGSPIEGKRVIVRCLRGYGDAVQYLRYASNIRARAERLIVQVAPAMVTLAKCFPDIDEVITWGEGAVPEPPWDMQVESAELPYLFRSTAEDLPRPPKLILPPPLLRQAKEACSGPGSKAGSKPRIGLVWTSGPWDATRSIPFPSLNPLLECGGFDFWSLQAAADNLQWSRHCPANRGKLRAGGEHSIEEMAAFAAQMDLVITVDTLAAHVAATLGRPVWLMLKHTADWRWMLGRSDSPWYPTMRLFRQSREGDWHGTVQAVRRELWVWPSLVLGK